MQAKNQAYFTLSDLSGMDCTEATLKGVRHDNMTWVLRDS